MKKRVIISALVMVLAVFGIVQSVSKISSATTAMAGIDTKLKVIIDPGHGGMDGGAVGYGETVEKDINLAISLKLREILLLNGFEVIMTRDDDRSIHDEGLSQIRMQKTSDMQNRLDIIKQNPDALFISIHQNKFPESGIWGAQIFYSPNNETSQKFAGILQSNFKEHIQTENNREIKAAGDGLYLLYNAKIPAVLVECGFISNPQECVNLKNDEYQKDVAYTIYYSIMELLAENNKGSEPVES